MRVSISRFISLTLSYLLPYKRSEESGISPHIPAEESLAGHPYASGDADGFSFQRSALYAFHDLMWSGNIIWLPRSSYHKLT